MQVMVCWEGYAVEGAGATYLGVRLIAAPLVRQFQSFLLHCNPMQTFETDLVTWHKHCLAPTAAGFKLDLGYARLSISLLKIEL